MKHPITHLALAAFAIALPASQLAHGKSFDAATAEAIIERHAGAIVEVQLVNRIGVRLVDGPEEIAEMFGEAAGEEQEMSAEGLVIDPSGIVVAPLMMLDPTELLGEINVPTPMGDITLALESNLSGARVLTADGAEMDADILRLDRTLGIVMLRVVDAPEAGMAAVTPDADHTSPAPFTELLNLSRLPAAFGYQPTATIIHTTTPMADLQDIAMVADPSMQSPSGTVFDADGQFRGILSVPMGAEGTQFEMSDIGMFLIPSHALQRLAASLSE